MKKWINHFENKNLPEFNLPYYKSTLKRKFICIVSPSCMRVRGGKTSQLSLPHFQSALNGAGGWLLRKMSWKMHLIPFKGRLEGMWIGRLVYQNPPKK